MVALEAIASAIGYITQALFLGFLAAASFLLPKGGPTAVRRKLLSMALVCLLFFIVIAVGTLLIQGAKLQRGEFPGWEILSRYLGATQSGNIWLFRESYGVVLMLILVWLIRQKEALTGLRLLTILAVPLIASPGFTSHAIAVRSDTALAVTADAVHLVATALWAGGLLAVLTALRRPSVTTGFRVDGTTGPALFASGSGVRRVLMLRRALFELGPRRLFCDTQEYRLRQRPDR